MPPQNNNNNSGGGFGRAASGTASRRDAARAEDLRVLVRGLAFMACTGTVLVLNAPNLWPHLFLRDDVRTALVAGVGRGQAFAPSPLVSGQHSGSLFVTRSGTQCCEAPIPSREAECAMQAAAPAGLQCSRRKWD